MKNNLIPLLIMLASCTEPVQYDLIIRNGLIYDGSGIPPIEGSVAINADTIAMVGDLGKATGLKEVNVEGMAISPGFINMLSWANISLIEDGRSQGDIRQGVTLEVMGEGNSMGPWTDAMKSSITRNQQDIKYEIEWTTLAEYLQYLEDKGVSTNIASFVGNGTLRQHVIGMQNRAATDQELEKMKGLLEEEMKQGAVGISSSLLYAPSQYANTDELIALAKVAGRFDGMYISHIRSEGESLIESINELITISREANISAEVYHLKASGVDNWPKLDSVFQLIEAARNDGLALTADMYTYPASSTGLHVQLPDWVREGGVGAAIIRLSNPKLRQRILEDIEWRNPPSKILLVGFKNENLRIYMGKRLDEVAVELGVSPEEAMIDLIVKDGSRIQVVYFSMSEENINKKIAKSWMAFCSDAGSYTNEGVFIKKSTHPRAYGSFIRVLGKFSRDEKLFPLEEGIRRLTSFPANNLKLKKRGLLSEGYFADIVVFDPEKVRDNATFEKPHQYAEGVIHVWVNGEQVLNDGEHTNATPGRFVKGPGWKE